MNSEYLTVKVFANKAGVSTQYVYKQIRDGKLSQYTENIDGKLFLKPEALEKVGKQKHDNQKSTNEQPIVSFLQDQLIEKDRQIAELQTALQRSQELLRTEQNIRYAVEKRILLLEGQQAAGADKTTVEAEKADTGDSGAVTGDSGSTDQNESTRPNVERAGIADSEEHETFWRRIWKTFRG